MRKQTDRSEPKQKNAFAVVITLAMLVLVVFMILSAVSQFRGGRIVSGCVSVLGAILFLGLTGLQIAAMIRQLRSRKNNQEDSHG